MKYIVLIGDGMADWPLRELDGQTPLQVAKTPNMDFLAKYGATGLARTVPKGMNPGSDIANMSIIGFDPKKYYSGRGPLEAASLGVNLKSGEVAFRCNLVTIKNDCMHDFTAGHISTSEAKKIIKTINKKIGSSDIIFYPGLSYRHLMVSKCGGASARCTPPHDITGKNIKKYLPKGKESDFLRDLMFKSSELLNGKKENMIWLWGQGKTPKMPLFEQQFGKRGAIITAVDLLKGMAIILGMSVVKVPGVTGFVDTNYKGKADYAIRALKNHDIVFVHVEAPDEAGHMGDTKLKIKAIEDFDKKIVGAVLKSARARKDLRILVMPDHPTPIKTKTHTAEPVPFVVWGPGIISDSVNSYNEKEIAKFAQKTIPADFLLKRVLLR